MTTTRPSSTPYQFIKEGQLFIIPVGPSISEVNYPVQSYTKPADHSVWVRGKIEEPKDYRLDRAGMVPSIYQDVRNDLAKFAPVEVTRVALRKSGHAYVGIIDSNGTPYYFALDGRGISVREASDDERVWKTFARLTDQERAMAVRQRRVRAADEMVDVDRELSEPMLVIKSVYSDERAREAGRAYAREMALAEIELLETMNEEGTPSADLDASNLEDLGIEKGRLRYGKQAEWKHDAPGSTWWRHAREKTEKPKKEAKQHQPKESKQEPAAPAAKPAKQPKVKRPKADDTRLAAWKQKYPTGAVADRHANPFEKGEDGKLHLVMLVDKSIKMTFDDDHQPFVHGGKGGPSCANCRHFVKEKASCASDKYAAAKIKIKGFSKPAGSHKLPTKWPPDELCSDWWEPAKNLSKAEVAELVKALPKKSKEKPASKKKPGTASKKQAGAGGKTRYTYPNEKKGGAKPGANQQQPLLVVQHDDSKHADPQELANQLGVSVRTLQRTAKRLGRTTFAKFMRSHLKRFAAKHRLDPDYWNTLYENLKQLNATQTTQT